MLETMLTGVKRVHLLHNSGNCGDGLIFEGAMKFLRVRGIEARVIFPDNEVDRGNILLVLGNGAFCKEWNHKARQLPKFYLRFKQIIILPASFDLNCQVVRNWAMNVPPNVTAFCREEESANRLSKFMKNVYLHEDMAFQLELPKTEGHGVLCSWRTDKESIGARDIPCDHSEDCSKGTQDDWQRLVNRINPYAVVHTDRLHCAIAANLMGKKAVLYPNSYHKNKSIYEYSLKNRGVEWQNV